MTGRRAAKTLAAAALATALVAPAAQAQDKPVEITFWSWLQSAEDRVAEFNESQDGIVVHHFNAGSGNQEYAALRTALETGVDVPDVVQMEYQALPSFAVRGDLLDLAPYGAAEDTDLFVPWTMAQVSIGEGIYAYPQDSGPMVMFCNTKILDDAGVAVPATWDEVAAAGAALQEAAPDKSIMNFTSDQGHFFGLLWQSGASPFQIDGETISVDFESPEVVRVGQWWEDALGSGLVSSIDTYTSDWNTAIANGDIACWTSGSWGAPFIESLAPDAAGDWRVLPMPQWDAANPTDGNYGGSTTAVVSSTAHPEAAAAFARWLNTDPGSTAALTQAPDNLFPVTLQNLESDEWAAYAPDYWGGEQINLVMAEGAEQVDTSFQWSPFTDYVYSTWAEELGNALSNQISFEQALANLETRSKEYAQEQGFTVAE